MKKAFAFLAFMTLIFLPAVFYIKLICDFEDFESLAAVERYEQNKKIEELEKEIRILKTDVHVIRYGFEAGE